MSPRQAGDKGANLNGAHIATAIDTNPFPLVLLRYLNTAINRTSESRIDNETPSVVMLVKQVRKDLFLCRFDLRCCASI